MVVLIPAFEPDGRLIELVEGLRAASLDVVVVDDGSGPTFADVFDRVGDAGADVLRHATNCGKGRALKTGFAHIEARFPGRSVVTADCDGQHRVTDVVAVSERLTQELARDFGGHQETAGREVSGRFGPIVLGVRSWRGRIPWKSRVGNGATRHLLRLATGLRLGDTQTGLRAFPAGHLGWLQQLAGERFEYEMQMLLAAHRAGVAVLEHPIETVYVDGNSSTHFDPVRDSVRVYLPLIRFAFARVTASGATASLRRRAARATGE